MPVQSHQRRSITLTVSQKPSGIMTTEQNPGRLLDLAMTQFEKGQAKEEWVKTMEALMTAHPTVYKYRQNLMNMRYIHSFQETEPAAVTWQDWEDVLHLEQQYPSAYFINIYDKAAQRMKSTDYLNRAINLCDYYKVPETKFLILNHALVSVIDVSFTDKETALWVLDMLHTAQNPLLTAIKSAALRHDPDISTPAKRQRKVGGKLGPAQRADVRSQSVELENHAVQITPV